MKLLFVAAFVFSMTFCQAQSNPAEIKNEILRIAEIYQGLGDPTGEIQAELDQWVQKLLVAAPMSPLADRLPLLYGAWKQVWGPYSYGDNKRGVDPSLDPQNIFQVIFEGGYYYNVNPKLDKKGKVISTTLLRGEFRQKNDALLAVQFTNLRKIKGLPPVGTSLPSIAQMSEEKKLKGERTVLPGFVVRRLFGGGELREVYTDHDLRITYGRGKNGKVDNYIYILKRVPLTL